MTQQSNQANAELVQNEVLKIRPYRTSAELSRAEFSTKAAIELKNAAREVLTSHDCYLPWTEIIKLSKHSDFLLNNIGKRKLSSHISLRFKSLYHKDLILPQKIRAVINRSIYNHYPNVNGVAHQALVDALELEFITKNSTP